MHSKFHFHFSEIIQMFQLIQNLRSSENYSAFYYEEVVDFDFSGFLLHQNVWKVKINYLFILWITQLWHSANLAYKEKRKFRIQLKRFSHLTSAPLLPQSRNKTLEMDSDDFDDEWVNCETLFSFHLTRTWARSVKYSSCCICLLVVSLLRYKNLRVGWMNIEDLAVFVYYRANK